jgi:hypothetical protein
MTVVVVLLCLVLAALVVLTVVQARRLGAQRVLAADATRRGEELSAELAATTAALESEAGGRAAADERVTAVTGERDSAEARAADAERRLEEERRRADDAESASLLDASLLWELEVARSERTWRNSVAIGPDEQSPLATSDQMLVAALHVELDAAREEVGAIVELDADLTARVTTAGSLMTLRVAQELLARVLRASESTTLRVGVDGRDVMVTVDATDVADAPVPAELATGSPALVSIDGGVRILGAVPASDEAES